jgi:hypothetical protein
MKRSLAAVIVAFAAVACDTSSKDGVQKVSHETTTISDKDLLAPAVALANDVIGATGDCDKITKSAPAAKAALDEAGGKVQSAAGHATVDSLKKQVEAAASACPGGAN